MGLEVQQLDGHSGGCRCFRSAGEGCYQQNSDLFKPWRPVATILGAAQLRIVDSVRCKKVLGRQEAFSDGIDPPAQAGSREEVGKKITVCGPKI